MIRPEMEKVVSTQLGNSHNHFHQSFSHDNCDHYYSYYNCDHFHQIIVITDHNGTILNPLLGGWLAASQAALRHIHLLTDFDLIIIIHLVNVTIHLVTFTL